MKKLISNQWVGIIPLLLCTALIVTGILSIHSNANLQGNARVINYTGIIRGATQRLIKQELHHTPNDDLILELDQILQGLMDGDEGLDLIRLEQKEFQSLLHEMEAEWQDIKVEIIRYRNGAGDEQLYALSEQYFDMANKAVGVAEEYTEDIV